MATPDRNSDKEKEQSYNHLKWPAIIIAILTVLLIAAFDYCSRQGKI